MSEPFDNFPGTYAWDVDERSFRAEIRDYLTQDPAPIFDRFDLKTSLAEMLAWHRRLAAAGFPLPNCPTEFGGRPRSVGMQLVQAEEMAAVGANFAVNIVGISMLTPLLMALGSAEQQARWLPPVAHGEELWCQLFSEPEAGSDLFGMRTTAIIDGADLRVTGQKIWSSTAEHADFGLMLARTEPGSTGRRGIGCFVVDMKSPGIDVRPIKQMGGSTEFAEVFFDDVTVPVANLIGTPGDGADAALKVLAAERSGLAMGSYAVFAAQFQELVRLCASRGTSGHRHALAKLWEALAVQRLNAIRQAGAETEEPTRVMALAAAGKLRGGTLSVMMQDLRAELLGMEIAAVDPSDQAAALVSERFVSSLGLSLGGGTHQMQRNAIAEGLLKMPRS
ncbi:acyl-CoA dehydrogenase family protein [Mycolicibacterium pulveris]|uniref:acyl-CoA dehydrogenase family protein n=1 Tax=Mycolicibacterium pulveris TaxID=36813 RepID=UPI0013D471C6|nr:acyl-CoA dehydrogenase family protein [Mycolicibacterium pulveris]MCV6983196.1 acyl-CoA dehydrogenase family protein [Mycolicibacterium pulveris]